MGAALGVTTPGPPTELGGGALGAGAAPRAPPAPLSEDEDDFENYCVPAEDEDEYSYFPAYPPPRKRGRQPLRSDQVAGDLKFARALMQEEEEAEEAAEEVRNKRARRSAKQLEDVMTGGPGWRQEEMVANKVTRAARSKK